MSDKYELSFVRYLSIPPILLLFLGFVIAQSPGPHINAPSVVLHDEPVAISVSGLSGGASYTLRAEFVTRSGTIWRSEAAFKADGSGNINPAAVAPVSGSYSTIDPAGLFWSMQNTRERQTDPSLFEHDDQSVITITVHEGEKNIAQHRLLLLKRQTGVSTTEIRGSITATFFAPYKAGRFPVVVVLGGSEGGLPRDRAALLASHGYATLALAYFGVDNLSTDLDRVPLEIVDRAVEWIRRQPGVDAGRIAILGVSKGAELALLSASRNRHLKAVVAIAPSSVVFQGLSQERRSSSSWTSGGTDLPFAPFVSSDEYSRSRRLIDLYNPTLAAATPGTVIPVEKISGPIMLLSGRDDALWPSTKMANQIAERLTQHHFPYAVSNRIFEDVGHHVATIPNRPTTDSVRLGGKPEALAKAQLQAWREIVDFLNARLRK